MMRYIKIVLLVALAPLMLFALPGGMLVSDQAKSPRYHLASSFFGVAMLTGYSALRNARRMPVLGRHAQEEEEPRWRSMFEDVPFPVLGYSLAGVIDYANDSALQATGYAKEDLIGRELSLVCPSDAMAMESDGRVFPAGLITRTGERRNVLWSVVELRDQDGAIQRILRIGNDVTERTKAEAGRDAALRELAGAKQELEAHSQYLKLEYEGAVHSTEILGKSDAIQYVLHKIGQVASTNATVLIEGETGVGKELVARAIHKSGPRSGQPFIRVNCAALPSPLIESELFGYEKGAFTGADRSRPGRFELAEGGTLFLDEVSELALDVQAKLLRVLQEGEYDRIGGTKTRQANVRIIAATNTSLSEAVAAGRFREDLYYRLQVFPITVPPLRDRKEDIPPLTQQFLERFSAKHRRTVCDIPMAVVNRLTAYHWPGNVRELENVVERAVITSAGNRLTLPGDFAKGTIKNGTLPLNGFVTLDEMERRYIQQVLQRTNGQIAGQGGAAEILGMHPNTLRSRMAKLGLKNSGSR